MYKYQYRTYDLDRVVTLSRWGHAFLKEHSSFVNYNISLHSSSNMPLLMKLAIYDVHRVVTSTWMTEDFLMKHVIFINYNIALHSSSNMFLLMSLVIYDFPE